jgi:hypothetical protein
VRVSLGFVVASNSAEADKAAARSVATGTEQSRFGLALD